MNVESSGPSRAVFLSYAREDTDAARRIAEALRSQGVEVWFDQAELRGGEAWDAKIKKQIRECTLFMAVVSAHTQDRAEGYFRREWKLAVERTSDMAAGVVFLVPVVVDETPEVEALAPEEFMRVQWTRLPGALPTPDFVAQVKNLLGGGLRKRPSLAPMAQNVTAAPMRTRPPLTPLPPLAPKPPPPPEPVAEPVKKSKRRSALPLVLLIVLILGGAAGGWFFMREPEPAPPPPKPVAAKKPAPVPAAVAPPPITAAAAAVAKGERSIAVLPFVNMSEDKDSGYFADGVHEDILTNLAHIATLRVVSRTSVMEYRGKTGNMREIAQKLGVVFVLEGSVRRSGNKVRITGQLIHAASDEHLWAQSYDRDLTDVFAIQAEVAQEIAKALSATLSAKEKDRLEHPSVANPAAYDLVLRARQIDRDGNDTRQEFEAAEALLQKAVTLEPGYAAAWSYLGAVHAQMRFNGLDTSEARLAKARTAMETAQRLDPENPDVIAGTGLFYYYALRDYPRALQEIDRVVQQWPNHYFGPFMKGLILRRQAKWVESLASLRRAAELDPGSAEQARNLVISLLAMRRYADAAVEQQRRVGLLPESLRESFEVARFRYFADGSTQAGDELLAGPIAARAAPELVAGYRKLWAALKGDFPTALRLDKEFPDVWGLPLGSGSGSPAEFAWNNAVLMAVQGDLAGARKRVAKFPAELRARLVTEPQNAPVWMVLAQIEALLGRKKEALAAAQQARAILPYSVDALSARGPHGTLALVLAWNGDKEAACTELKQLLTVGGQYNVYSLRNGPWFASLKGYPPFEALLNDPKNNQPLF